MSIVNTIDRQLMEAAKNGDKERMKFLRMLLSTLMKKTRENGVELSEAEEYKVVREEIKQMKATMELASADRTDAAQEWEKKIAVYQEFMPEEISEDEIREMVQKVLSGFPADTSFHKVTERVMQEVMPKATGRADDEVIMKIVGEMLYSWRKVN